MAQEPAEFGEVGCAAEIDQARQAGAEEMADGTRGRVVDVWADEDHTREAAGFEQFDGQPHPGVGRPAQVFGEGGGIEDGVGFVAVVEPLEPGGSQADAQRREPGLGQVDLQTEGVGGSGRK